MVAPKSGIVTKEDPVDAWERERARRIEAIQGNRNPFIWGEVPSDRPPTPAVVASANGATEITSGHATDCRLRSALESGKPLLGGVGLLTTGVLLSARHGVTTACTPACPPADERAASRGPPPLRGRASTARARVLRSTPGRQTPSVPAYSTAGLVTSARRKGTP